MKYIVQRTMLPRKHEQDQRYQWLPYVGDCLQGFGIPSKGMCLIDKNTKPVVGDFVVCTKIAGSYSGFIKKVIQLDDGDYTVTTSYLDKDKDYTFVAGQVFGTVLRIKDQAGHIVYKRT